MTPEQVREMQLSKKMSLVLRHKAPELGIALDDGGWGLLSDIMRLSMLRGGGYDIDDVKKMVSGNDKQRFSLKMEGDKYYIRANQGCFLFVCENF
jgi:RNA:NAD 2'-phosphotransferase (TPT1/KptA family)